MKIDNILDIIGNTAHLRLRKLFPDHEVWIKLEKENPGGSIKDRIALAMINDAEEKGILKPGSIIIEPTSGNTGIGLAMVAAVKGYKIILVMPESMSKERRQILKAYGAQIELTPKKFGMKGAIDKSRELLSKIKDTWMPSQFDNSSNPNTHKVNTAKEILSDFPDGIDYLITGVGSGGHITGVGEVLKYQFKNIKIYAVEPDTSAVISGDRAGMHPIQGIGAGFIPDNLNIKIIDRTIKVSKEKAFEFTHKLAQMEGLFVGISTGASIAAINSILTYIPKGSRILTFAYDSGEKYLSVNGLFDF